MTRHGLDTLALWLLLYACLAQAPVLQAQVLPNSLTVTSATAPAYQANQTITTSGTVTVANATSTTFEAGTTVDLKPGFHAATGSGFHAFIAAPDFIISVTPITGVVLAGSSASYSVTVTSIFGFAGAVNFSPLAVTGLPQGASASFSAASITPPANSTSSAITLTIATAAGVAGNYAFTVVGASLGYPSHLGTSSLSIQDFYLTLTPSQWTAAPRTTVPYQLTATAINGFNGPIYLGFQWDYNSTCVSGTPTGPAGSMFPGSTVSFNIIAGTQLIGCGFHIYGNANPGLRSVAGALVVNTSGGSLSAACSGSPNPGQTGHAIAFTASVTGGTAPYAYYWSGASGGGQTAYLTPTSTGYNEASLSVSDANGATGAATCAVNVQQGSNALTITTSSTLPYGAAGSAYSVTLAASGGTGSYTWSAASTLPTGLSLSGGGVLSGTVSTAGSYTFYIRVADTGGHSVTSEFALPVATAGSQSGIQISLAYPQFSGGYPGGAHRFTFHYTDPLGPSNIAGGQVVFNLDPSGPNEPVCQLDWYANGNIDITGLAYGNFGSGLLSSTYCNVYTAESSLTQTAQGYDVSVVISFPQPLPNTLVPAWARGSTLGGVTGAHSPKGGHLDLLPFPGDLPPEVLVNGVDIGGDLIEVPPSLGIPQLCGGAHRFLNDLARYADGTLAATLSAFTTQLGHGGPGWVNEATNGHLLSQSANIGDSGNADVTSTDHNVAIVPFGTGPGYMCQNSSTNTCKFQVVGDYSFSHLNPFCVPMLPYGTPGYENDGVTAYIFGYTQDFDLSSDKVDPTPVIDSVTPVPPLVSGDTSVATILGRNFGTATPTVSLACSSDNPSPPCTNSDVTAVVLPSTPGCQLPTCILATLTATSNAFGDYDLQVTSNGTINGNGFQPVPGPQAKSNTKRVQVQQPTISGRVTNSAGQGVASVRLETTNTPLPFATNTDDNGYYSIALPGGGTYTLEPSESTGNYWFDPQSVTFSNLSSNQAANFTEKPVTTVYLIHGILQDNTAMQALYQQLTGPNGVDTRKYRVDAGFTFSCAKTCDNSCVDPTSGTVINVGASRLGNYILFQQPPGNIILVGYSLGGLIARDFLANNYTGILTGHPVKALITLGTPNLGYPWSSADYLAPVCSQLLLDMLGSWIYANSTWSELTSPYLSTLQQQWASASYSGFWMAAAGEQCSTTPRNIPPTSMAGCPSWSVTSDGVVCRDSALYGAGTAGYPGFNGGSKPYSSPLPWVDVNHRYVHTNTFAGWALNGYSAGIAATPPRTHPSTIPIRPTPYIPRSRR